MAPPLYPTPSPGGCDGAGQPLMGAAKTPHLKKRWPAGYPQAIKKRAANEARTRDPQLGKLMLYQLSYCRIDNPSSRGRIGYAKVSIIWRLCKSAARLFLITDDLSALSCRMVRGGDFQSLEKNMSAVKNRRSHRGADFQSPEIHKKLMKKPPLRRDGGGL